MTAAIDPRFERRLASFLERRPAPPSGARAGLATRAGAGNELARVLAVALDGEVVTGPAGTYVRVERPSRAIPVDRDRLADLPGQPPADAPLVCLDTETTGLGTAAGTVAFLVGLGWWVADQFRQVQLVLPDHAAEPALLAALAALLPPEAWLVTYNGRGFDWPLLVTRFRMQAREPPPHAGHLDLLGVVRRLFRHRLPDARLRTVEDVLLDIRRPGDVEGWQIPSRYLEFLHLGRADGLVEVVRHNDQDVRSLARLVGLLERRYARPEERAAAPPGDLAGLARAFARERRLAEALDCLDMACAGSDERRRDPFGRTPVRPASDGDDDIDLDARGDPWWAPRRRADLGGPVLPPAPVARSPDVGPWTSDRIAVERARLLRRIGRTEEALAAWRAISARPGRLAASAWIEIAKIEEHVRRDPGAALHATDEAGRLAERSRLVGLPVPGLESDLARRRRRLRARIGQTGTRAHPAA